MKISTLIQPVLKTGIYSVMIFSMISFPSMQAFSHGEGGRGDEGQVFDKSSSTTALKTRKPTRIILPQKFGETVKLIRS